MSKKAKLIVLAATALIVVAAVWWLQSASRTRSLVARAIPTTPDLSASPSQLQDEFAAAEAQARSRFGARNGLARLSQLCHANGFLDEAMQCYAGLEQLEPSEPRWFHLHATILAGFGETEPAIALWQKAIRLAPDYLPAQLRLGDSQLKANRPDEAAATYSAVLKRAPDNPYALLGLARIDYEAQRWEEAKARLETVVRQTDYTLGYDLIVTLYERTGEPEKARALRSTRKASGAFRDPPDPWLDQLMDACFDTYRLALTAGFIARNGDPAKAVQLLERAIELSPDDVASRFQLGVLSTTQGNTTVAREQFERCTRLAPDFADGWAQLSALEAQLGDQSAAAATLAKGLANCPQSPGLHLMRARNLQKSGATNEAVAEFRESIRLRPNEAEAYIELAGVLINLGRVDEAVLLLQQSLEAEPGNPMALSTLAFHAISVGDEASAQRWYARVRNQPRVPIQQIEKIRAAYQQQFGRVLR